MPDSHTAHTAGRTDAALKLVPKGYTANLGNDKPIWAQVWIGNNPMSRGGGTTMALALCAAALRARSRHA